jgi:hypothetical protein
LEFPIHLRYHKPDPDGKGANPVFYFDPEWLILMPRFCHCGIWAAAPFSSLWTKWYSVKWAKLQTASRKGFPQYIMLKKCTLYMYYFIRSLVNAKIKGRNARHCEFILIWIWPT